MLPFDLENPVKEVYERYKGKSDEEIIEKVKERLIEDVELEIIRCLEELRE